MDELEPESGLDANFDVTADGAGTAIVTIGGDLDISNVDALEAEVAPVLAGASVRLIVDVGGLRFADSSAIALWVRWATIVNEFELRDPSPLLRRVITRMGLAEKLAVTP
jgi:anti-anti-sigma factor